MGVDAPFHENTRRLGTVQFQKCTFTLNFHSIPERNGVKKRGGGGGKKKDVYRDEDTQIG